MRLIKWFFIIFSMLLILLSAGCKEDKENEQGGGEQKERATGEDNIGSLPELSINNQSVTEGDDGTNFIKMTVTCSTEPSEDKDVTVKWSTADPTGTIEARATAGKDYSSDSGVLTFKKGGPLQQEIIVNVKSDTVAESDEVFLVTLESPVNATVSVGVGEALILNNDVGNIAASDDTKFANLPSGTIIADHYDDFSWNDYDGDAAYREKSISGQEFTKALQVKISSAPSASSRVNMTINSPMQLQQDDIILVSFYARTITPSSTGSGRLTFLLQHNGEPWTQYVSWPMDIGTDWKRYYIPFSIQTWRAMRGEYYVAPPSDGDDKTFGANEVRFRLSLGYYPQILQFADMRIVNYGTSISGTQLPVTPLSSSKTDNVIIEASSPSTDAGKWKPDLLTDAEAGNVYLPDFSYAGYHNGEGALPSGRGWTSINVLDHGATPDDGKDDTAAIKSAIAAAEKVNDGVVVVFPAGQFILRDVLVIDKENFILRGAGSRSGGTVLSVPRPMSEMTKPALIQDLEDDISSSNRRTGEGDLYSPFSWSGGVIWLGNTDYRGATGTAAVTKGTALRGSHTVGTKDASNVTPGDVVQLRYYDNSSANPLHEHVYGCSAGDLPDGFGSGLAENPEVWQNITVESVSGNEVRFKEPLNHDIQSGWSGQLKTRTWFPEMGVEGIAIEFPDVHYAGHHIEEGYNGIFIKDGLNCWVRDVKVTNSDSGIIVETSKNITIKDVIVDGRGGHYALMTANSDQVLFRDFQSYTRTCHNLSFNTASRTAVYTHGRVNAVSFDQHNGMNHQNLMEDLDVFGEVRDLWVHGGNDSEKPTHGAFNTFWNLRFSPAGQVPVQGTPIPDGPNAYMVGLASDALLMFTYGPHTYTEGLGRRDLAVPSLYEYQLMRRISGASGQASNTVQVENDAAEGE